MLAKPAFVEFMGRVPQRRPPPQRGVTVRYPGLEGGTKSQPTLLTCDLELLMTSANGSRVESCSGGAEFVRCL